MRTTSRLAASTAVLGGALFLAGPVLLTAPAAAQTVTPPCPTYPFDCPSPTPTDGGEGSPSVSPTSRPISGGGGGPSVDNPSSLPFTGGELTLMALVGAGAVGGGAALVTAGRKRSAA